MRWNDLYGFALTLILVAMIAGVGVLTTDKFAQTSGIGTTAAASINAGRDAIAAINNTWLSLVVTIGVLAIILGLVIAGFAFRGGR